MLLLLFYSLLRERKHKIAALHRLLKFLCKRSITKSEGTIIAHSAQLQVKTAIAVAASSLRVRPSVRLGLELVLELVLA